MPVSQDAYVSFRGPRRRDFGTVQHPEPVIFVDLDTSDVEVLRGIPASFSNQRQGVLLLRGQDLDGSTESLRSDLQQLFDKWDIYLEVRVLEQPVGEAPRIVSLDGSPAAGADDILP